MSMYRSGEPLPDETAQITAKNTSPWRILLQNFIFCTLIALFLWQFVPLVGQYGFVVNFIHSQAIGTSITLLAIATNVLTTRAGFSSPVIKLMIVILATPVGIMSGLWIAGTALGLPRGPLEYLQHKDQLLITACVAILASAAFNWHLSRRSRINTLELQAAKEKHRADIARHAMLRAQLEPHMLFNTLANLRALIDIDKHRAIEMLDHLDNFLRATLKSSQTSTHTLDREFSVLEDYLKLMQIRLASRLRYTLNFPTEHAAIRIPALILQPVVENAIQHGIEPQIDGGEVHVSARVINNKLELQVTDTGVGIEPEATLNSTAAPKPPIGGFGLTSLRERLDQSYHGNARLIVTALDQPQGQHGGTQVTINIPLTETSHG